MDDDLELDDLNLSDEKKEKIISALRRMLEMGMAGIYGIEVEEIPDRIVDCHHRIADCRARCCTLNFALTKKEVSLGIYRHNPQRPFFIAQEADGYCAHLNRNDLRCSLWEERPLRCRRYCCEETAGAAVIDFPGCE